MSEEFLRRNLETTKSQLEGVLENAKYWQIGKRGQTRLKQIIKEIDDALSHHNLLEYRRVADRYRAVMDAYERGEYPEYEPDDEEDDPEDFNFGF